MKLTDGDKFIIYMLAELMKGLKVRTELDPKFIQNAILEGHTWALEWRYKNLIGDETNRATVKEVMDILDMWSFIEPAWKKMSKGNKERIAKEADPFGDKPRFTGFDGNNESAHCAVARFLIDQMGSFEMFKRRDLNCHHPSLDRHRRMLRSFDYIRPKLADTPMSADQLIEVLR
jgi:uncharacterized protein YfbU (UPF0304 family)